MLRSVDSERGFFRSTHRALADSLSRDDLEAFSSLRTDQERFQWLWSVPEAHKPVLEISPQDKDAQQAQQYKNDGNKAFQKGDNRTAARLYSKSILYMPVEPPEELAVVFANRSAAFYHLEEYRLAIEDIASALEGGYPKHLRYKVLDRKARCLLAMKQHSDAKSTFQATLTALDDSSLPLERRQKSQMDIQIMLSMLNSHKQLGNQPMPESGIVEPPPASALLHGPHTDIRKRCASATLRFQSSPEEGRFVTAGSDIAPGDFLVVQPAAVAVLLQERASTHCFNCCRRLRAPVGCLRCSAVLFCGRACRDAAERTHHSVECSVLPNLWASGASVTCLMALRALSQLPKGGVPDESVTSLVTHTERRKPEDLLHRTHMAVFLARCLQVSGHAGEGLDLAATGGRLLTLLQLLQFNAHEVSELQLEAPRSFDTARSVFLGGALYPTLALFNHSCDPGLVRYFCGTTVVARAIRGIRAGESVCENYGPIYSTTPRLERRDALQRQYWFSCQCSACEEDWPLLGDMDQDSAMRFRCDAGKVRCNNVLTVPADTLNFMAQCGLCKQHTNILKGLKALQDTDNMLRLAQSALSEGSVSDALNRFISILRLLEEVLVPPFRDYVLCQQSARTCMVALGNNVVLATLTASSYSQI